MSEFRLPTVDDFADAEHFVLEDTTDHHPTLDNLVEGRRNGAARLSKEISVNDRLRRRLTTVRLYAEGWAEIATARRGREPVNYLVDLRYLDPTPARMQYRPVQLLKTAGILGGCTGIVGIVAVLGWFAPYTVLATVLGGIATLGTLFLAYYRSHEKVAFRTLHGRAQAIRLEAGLGTIRQLRAMLPEIVQAIAAAAESVHAETAVYLRAEMREHYRLRTDGVLSVEECAESTGRILGEFDAPV
jgi:hypothetical protein